MIFNKNVNYKYKDFEVKEGKLYYKNEEIEDIEKFNASKEFLIFRLHYKDEVRNYDKKLKEAVLKRLRELEKELKGQEEIAIIEYEMFESEDRVIHEERVVLKWSKDKGYYFEGQEYDNFKDEWEKVDWTKHINFFIYKNLKIDEITTLIAREIASDIGVKE